MFERNASPVDVIASLKQRRNPAKGNWVSLPVEGCELRSCLLTSCGKRGTMAIVTAECPPLNVPLHDPVIFSSPGGLEQRFISLDDANVALIIEPLSGTRIRLTEAKVDFWLENEDPITFFERAKSEDAWTLGYNPVRGAIESKCFYRLNNWID